MDGRYVPEEWFPLADAAGMQNVLTGEQMVYQHWFVRYQPIEACLSRHRRDVLAKLREAMTTAAGTKAVWPKFAELFRAVAGEDHRAHKVEDLIDRAIHAVNKVKGIA